ncbi:MAG: hypothetical protein AB7U34_10200 [Novosphingobium sp.]
MTPNPTIRLQSLLQTLEHVIFPAVDSQNSLAQEQCGLVLGQLRMLIQHMPWFGAYHALCYDDLARTVAGLPAHSGGDVSGKACAALAQVLARTAGMEDRNAAYHDLGHALETLLRAVAEDGERLYRRAVEAQVLDFSRRQSLRARTWFKDAGFDHAPENLPSLEQML